MITKLRWLALVILVTGIGGCSDGGNTVKGKVSLDGKFLNTGTITCYPLKGEPISDAIQPDGSYELKGVQSGDSIFLVDVLNLDITPDHESIKKAGQTGKNAPIAPKAAPKAPASTEGKFIIPVIYKDPGTSPLKKPIKSGTNVIDIELTTKQ
jgi:hypothetical protein